MIKGATYKLAEPEKSLLGYDSIVFVERQVSFTSEYKQNQSEDEFRRRRILHYQWIVLADDEPTSIIEDDIEDEIVYGIYVYVPRTATI